MDAGRQVDFLREAVVAVPCPDCGIERVGDTAGPCQFCARGLTV